MTQTKNLVTVTKPKADYEGHRQRMKNRVLEKGSNALTEQDILEMLLMYAAPRKDVKPQAKELLRTFKNLRNILTASPTELEQIKGVKTSACGILKLVEKICTQAITPQPNDTIHLLLPKDIANYCFLNTPYVKGHRKILAVYLKRNGGLLKKEVLDVPTRVHLRDVLKQTLEAQAENIVLAQYVNEIESKFTLWINFAKDMQNILSQMGIRMVDYMLIYEGQVISLIQKKTVATFTAKQKNLALIDDDNKLCFDKTFSLSEDN